MAMKKKSRSTGKKKKNTAKSKSVTKITTWVDKLGWESLENETSTSTSNKPNNSLSIVSWNVLAQSYLSKRSHGGLPRSYQSRVFDKPQRQDLLLKNIRRLAKLNTDILCLQEVDLPSIDKQLNALSYTGVSTPTTNGGGGGGRVDACCIYWNRDKFESKRQQVVRLDDLAYNTTATSESDGDDEGACNHADNKDENNNKNGKNGNKLKEESPLIGLQQSFLRRNAGILVELTSCEDGSSIIIANAHLYWHPGYEYVKLCQAHYVLECLKKFNTQHHPIVFCGDLNSLPGNIVHDYLTFGKVNAQRLAPWWHYKDEENINIENTAVARDEGEDAIVPILVDGNDTDGDFDISQLEEKTNEQGGVANMSSDNGNAVDGPPDMENGISEKIEICRITDGKAATSKENSGAGISNTKENNNIKQETPKTRYLLDFTLNRFTRWLRILGIDAALETSEEEEERTKRGNFVLFERCRQEQRTLVTTSTKLLLRKDCPPGTYLVDSRMDLHEALVHLCLSHGVVLEPRLFLTRCVVCNGNILEVFSQEQKRRIFDKHQAPVDLSEELNVYCCNGCGQGYWWCDKPGSSASRVKEQATKLFEMCLRGGVPIQGDLHMFDFVNVQEERRRGEAESKMRRSLDVVKWLKNQNLSHSLPLESAYGGDGELPFTNVTDDFVGTLDYVFFDSEQCTQIHRLYVPRTFEQLKSDQDLHNGHLLPSNIWPSDHLAIGARLVLSSQDEQKDNKTKETSDTEVVLNAVKSIKVGEDVDTGQKPDILPPVGESSSNSMQKSNAVPVSGTLGGASPPPMTLPTLHGQRCTCGCVPNVLSLFEMAELRKHAKLKAKGVAEHETNKN